MSSYTEPYTMIGFDDPTFGGPVALIVPDEPGALCEISHGGCPVGGDLTVELDAWYCTECRHSGRISGAWAVEQIERVRRVPFSRPGDKVWIKPNAG